MSAPYSYSFPKHGDPSTPPPAGGSGPRTVGTGGMTKLVWMLHGVSGEWLVSEVELRRCEKMDKGKVPMVQAACLPPADPACDRKKSKK